jgi:hypothetical protein
VSETRPTPDGERDEIAERLAVIEQRLDAIQQELEIATNRDIPLLKGTIRGIVATEIDTIDELPAAGRTFGEQLVARGERVSEIEGRLEMLKQSRDPSTKAEKVATVLAFAANKADSDGKVAVTPFEIRGCTGVSRRYAYDLVETIAADVEGVQVRESKQVSTANGTKHKQKALLVDCEQVHGLADGVNSFTTGEGDTDEQ